MSLTNRKNYCSLCCFLLLHLKTLHTFAGKSGDPVGNVSQFLPSSTTCVGNPFHVNYISCSICLLDQMSDRPQGNDVESEKRRKLRDEQRSLHLLLKPEIAKLCEILLLPVCSLFFSLLSFTCCLFVLIWSFTLGNITIYSSDCFGVDEM